MADICLGFEVHQPFRLNRNFKWEEAKGKSPEELLDIYFDNDRNERILTKVAKKCYLPTNEIILENIGRYRDQERSFKVAFSISGVLIKQLEQYSPKALESFERLAESECVELLDQTFYHSLSSLYSSNREEFVEQVQAHKEYMKDRFGCEPIIFENTEFIYDNSIAKTLEKMGYKGVFTEGAERILGWRSPNYVYRAKDSDIRVFTRNYRLSDDIGFRFSNHDWSEWPLTADKYALWLSEISGECVNVFVDYKTFGEHHWSDSGIHDFLSCLPGEVLNHKNLRFVTPSELLENEPEDEIDVRNFHTLSWADEGRDVSAWLGNGMQRICFDSLKELEAPVKRTENEELLEIWRLLQTSDHFYYMYTGGGPSGEVRGYFSQQTPYGVFKNFSKIISDFREKVLNHLGRKGHQKAQES